MRWIWTRLDRIRRRLGFDRNDLRRGIDRVQWALATLLVLVFLAAAAVTATVVSGRVYHSGLRTEHREAADRHQVVATIVSGGAPASPARRDTGAPTVRMRWQTPNGAARTGDVQARGPGVTGARELIWIDGTGAVTAPPRRHVQTIGNAVYAGSGTAAVIGVPLLVAYGVLRRRCNRRRFELWDTDWARLDRRTI